MNKDVVQKLNTQELLGKLDTSNEGLSTPQAQNRLSKYGLNKLKSDAKRTTLDVFLAQFKSSLIYLLIIASILSFALKDNGDGIIILVILIVNTGIGFYQGNKSENAIEKLQKLIDREILVKRDNKETLINEEHLVMGDLVILREGDIVPADIRLTRSEDLSVNESQLTGESVPVTKTIEGKDCLVFAGSTVENGEGEGYIFATSKDTELGKIAHLSTSTKKVTQYEKSLTSFSTFLIRVTFLTLAAVFILKILIDRHGTNITEMGLFIIALSIAVVPEAMPVIATLTLSSGAMKLAKRHVIAKTLTAVEDFGNITVLCSDKTGTLTENQQIITKLVTDNKDLFNTLAIAGLETLDEKRKKFQSIFDRAFIKFVPEDMQNRAKSFKRLAELPFDPHDRRRRVVISDGKITYLVEVGAVETLLELTEHPKKVEYLKDIKNDGKQGLRHIGIAYKEINYKADNFDILKHEDHLKFLGFVSMSDPLRATAKKTIEYAKQLGVSIKILSGDSREVTNYVGSEVGLVNDTNTTYTGEQIDAMSDEKLTEVLKTNHVFAQMNPEQKYRVIKILKQAKETVGYQGDGINDAPALKLADVAIAVNNATDIAQDSADILLLRNDLEVIINGINYGRSIFSNINKYIRYTMIGNFGNFFALAILYLASGLSLPMLPVQLILTSLLTDIPLIAIATDNVDPTELNRPSKYNVKSLIFVSMFLGTITAVFEILFYLIVKHESLNVAQTSLFLFVTLLGLIIILSVRTKNHFWQAVKMSTDLKIAFVFITILSLAIVYIHETKKLFSFSNISFPLFLITLLVIGIYLYVLDVAKVWFYHSKAGSNA